MSMAVPRIIHQTWSDDSPPGRLASFAASWRALHPGWDYRFWTDRSTRSFVAARFPWFLATYDGYGSPIMRVDAARYLWMWHFGGVYIDLDMEPVRALDPLLMSRGDAQLLIAREPDSHARLHGRRTRLDASPPGLA
jgi:mannosyltransferase OCH1-like enzyme